MSALVCSVPGNVMARQGCAGVSTQPQDRPSPHPAGHKWTAQHCYVSGQGYIHVHVHTCIHVHVLWITLYLNTHTHTHTHTEPVCTNGQRYTQCGSECPLTCENMANPPVCPEVCVAGCFCPAGEVLNGVTCVNPSQCPSMFLSSILLSIHVIHLRRLDVSLNCQQHQISLLKFFHRC